MPRPKKDPNISGLIERRTDPITKHVFLIRSGGKGRPREYLTENTRELFAALQRVIGLVEDVAHELGFTEAGASHLRGELLRIANSPSLTGKRLVRQRTFDFTDVPKQPQAQARAKGKKK